MSNIIFHSWPNIVNFHTLKRNIEKYPQLLDNNSSITYRSKIKLHGTNAAIQVTHDEFAVQNRTSIITSEKDNHGFAKWAYLQKDLWMFFAESLQKTIIFGEWCGPGINKGVAINKLDRPIFAIFAIHKFYYQLNVEQHYKEEFIIEPELIKQIIRPKRLKDVYILPWFSTQETIDFYQSDEQIQPTVDRINAAVLEVEKCDPWAKNIFGIEGVGEGLVFYPNRSGCENFGNFAFKAKGKEHQNVTAKESVQINPVAAESIDEFVKLVLAPARLEQGVRAVNNGELTSDMKQFGNLLKWINQDIIKENQAELEAANLVFKQVSPAIANYTRAWYQNQ